jgi:hypothetical protein
MRTTIILIVLAAALACSSAQAQQPGEPAMEWFHRMDRNKDSKLSYDEVPSPRFKEFDANGDGFVTEEEFRTHTGRAASGQGTRRRSPGNAAISDDVLKALTYHKDSPGPVPLSDSKAFTDLQFTRDWKPGTKDHNDRLMTGTECNYIVAHDGRLYAAVSMWNHDPAAPNPGPSVLVKPSASAAWEVDTYFPPPSLRVAVLASLTFTTDGLGKRLAKPVSLLVAGGSLFESPSETAVFVRDDATGKWGKSLLAGRSARDRGEVRLLKVHRDQVTGVDRVIVAVTNGNVYGGAFDAAAPGKIRWDSEAELSGRMGRIMSCGEANGQAYLAVDITPDQPKNGGLFRRVDGLKPSWEWIGEWGHRVQHRGVAWARGLTAIPDPERHGKEVLLCSREVDGVIEIIDPQQGAQAARRIRLAEAFRRTRRRPGRSAAHYPFRLQRDDSRRASRHGRARALDRRRRHARLAGRRRAGEERLVSRASLGRPLRHGPSLRSGRYATGRRRSSQCPYGLRFAVRGRQRPRLVLRRFRRRARPAPRYGVDLPGRPEIATITTKFIFLERGP